MVILLTFIGLVLLRFAAVLFLAALVVRPVDACPACFAPRTIPVRLRILRPLGSRYQWRWCPACGWQALTARAHPPGSHA